MSPARLSAAIDLAASMENVAWTRVFLLFKGVSDEEMNSFAGSGEKEAAQFNWQDTIGWSDQCRDTTKVRIFEVSVMDCTW